MNYAYTLSRYAQEDYKASLKWYAERSEQAAENFVVAIDEALKLICENPERWNNKHENFYEFRLKNYPFLIIYTIEQPGYKILVSAIYHTNRNPRGKYRKI